jgi:hypothetical protein
VVEADLEPHRARNRRRRFVVGVGADDVAEGLQAFDQEAGWLAVRVCVVSGARPVVVAQGQVFLFSG